MKGSAKGTLDQVLLGMLAKKGDAVLDHRREKRVVHAGAQIRHGI